MAKRQVVECDLTKQEVEDAASLVTITIKAEGKKPRSYDLSPEAAAKLEAQLTATRDRKLSQDWDFASASSMRPAANAVDFEPTEVRQSSDRETLTNVKDDDSWVHEKKRELKRGNRTRKEEPAKKEEVAIEVVASDDGSGCPHMNKGRVRMEIREDQQYAYHICRDCGSELPAMTRVQKEAFIRGKPPEGVNVRDISR